jgi:predicted transcriptional regulator
MKYVIFSIHPKFSKLIFTRIKIYEYRKNLIRNDVNKMLIYETNPTKKIVGEASINSVIHGSLDYVWQKTYGKGGIDISFYNKYYAGKEYAVAYELTDIIKYDEPIELSFLGIKVAPQSHRYVELNDLK